MKVDHPLDQLAKSTWHWFSFETRQNVVHYQIDHFQPRLPRRRGDVGSQEHIWHLD